MSFYNTRHVKIWVRKGFNMRYLMLHSGVGRAAHNLQFSQSIWTLKFAVCGKRGESRAEEGTIIIRIYIVWISCPWYADDSIRIQVTFRTNSSSRDSFAITPIGSVNVEFIRRTRLTTNYYAIINMVNLWRYSEVHKFYCSTCIMRPSRAFCTP